ncbi:MAG: methyltransferase domain-containing protein [Chloroflexota bacterium]
MDQQTLPEYEQSAMETTPCPLCGGADYREEIEFSPFTVVQCQACELYYLSPRLTAEAITKIYQQDNYFDESAEGGYSSYLEQELALRATYRRFLKGLKREGLSGGDLLEIGCGFGYFLDEARPYFKHTTGTDFSSGACQAAGEVADHVFLGGLAEVPAEMSANLIVALNVLEHTYDPVQFLKDASSKLSAGGKIIMAVPNMDSFIRKLMGRGWPSYKVPEHTLYFIKNTLIRVMQEAGLQNVKTTPFLHAFPVNLIASKFKLKLPSAFQKLMIWVPTTMVAAIGEKNE